MTDNEIIKALKCCSETTGSECSECPLLNADCSEYDLYKLALDLINRIQDEKQALINGQETLQNTIVEQKAEIDRLQKEAKQTTFEKVEHNSLCETETYKGGEKYGNNTTI